MRKFFIRVGWLALVWTILLAFLVPILIGGLIDGLHYAIREFIKLGVKYSKDVAP